MGAIWSWKMLHTIQFFVKQIFTPQKKGALKKKGIFFTQCQEKEWSLSLSFYTTRK